MTAMPGPRSHDTGRGLSSMMRRSLIAAVLVYEFRERKIVRETRIYDFTGVLIQIGLLKAKPA